MELMRIYGSIFMSARHGGQSNAPFTQVEASPFLPHPRLGPLPSQLQVAKTILPS